MTTTTEKTRTKAKSEPLLDPDEYATTPVERLHQERVTINNRLSGLNTQIKRYLAAGDTEKERQARERRDDLTANRTLLAQSIAAKATTLDGATHAAAAAAVTPKAAPAAKRKTRAAAKTAPAKRTTAKRSTAKRTTAKGKPAGGAK